MFKPDTNAKQELLSTLKDINKTIDDISDMVFIDKRDYGHTVIKDIDNLDFDYDSGYGLQELGGVVVFKDGSWLERGEYDGSEWWEYKKTPTKEDIIKMMEDKR